MFPCSEELFLLWGQATEGDTTGREYCQEATCLVFSGRSNVSELIPLGRSPISLG